MGFVVDAQLVSGGVLAAAIASSSASSVSVLSTTYGHLPHNIRRSRTSTTGRRREGEPQHARPRLHRLHVARRRRGLPRRRPGEEHRSGGWVIEDVEFLPEAFALKGEELAETTALMFGRRSYEAFAPTWRDSQDHAAYKDLPKYVVSSTISEDALVEGWGETTILRSGADVAGVEDGEGGAIFIHGSAELARRLSDAGLIDRYNLLVFPVLLGAGKRLFSEADRDKQKLRPRESQSYPNDVVKLLYDVVG
jgi:dihydrofolate reductase